MLLFPCRDAPIRRRITGITLTSPLRQEDGCVGTTPVLSSTCHSSLLHLLSSFPSHFLILSVKSLPSPFKMVKVSFSREFSLGVMTGSNSAGCNCLTASKEIRAGGGNRLLQRHDSASHPEQQLMSLCLLQVASFSSAYPVNTLASVQQSPDAAEKPGAKIWTERRGTKSYK